MVSLSVSTEENVSAIPKLILLLTRIATLPPLPACFITARNDKIRNIELKITYKPSFTESEDVNIILIIKEGYFPSPYFCCWIC